MRMLTSEETDELVRTSFAAEDSCRAIIKRAAAKMIEVNEGQAVAEVYRYGRDSAGRKWHGIHWYDPNVDVPSGTKLYVAPPAGGKA